MAVLDRPPWRIAAADPGAAEFARILGVHPLVAGILRRRGIETAGAARAFLSPTLDDLTDPSRIPRMDDAAAAVAAAIRSGRPIAIHGDYDVDGITATAILVRGLRALGAALRWRLPHRIADGYGLGIRAVEALAGEGAGLLIAADCGITALEPVRRARTLGLDVVVLDHHIPGAESPPATIVAPAPDDQDAPCAAGLAFFFVWALRRQLGQIPPLPGDLLALAALGTIADVVPLIGDNRRIAAAGIEQMRTDPPLGVRALLEEAAIAGPIDAWHIGWQVAPRLNAPGRLGDPTPSLDLLLTDDPAQARALAQTLDTVNRERQAILDQMLTEAIAQMESSGASAITTPAGLVVAGEGWHPGVVGLVAARLVDAYRRPAVAIALPSAAEGARLGRGSARSVAGFDLVTALGECSEHLAGFGGHAMAAGLSIDAGAIPAFRECFARHAAHVLAGLPPARMEVDAEVALEELTEGFVGELERLAPFGPGNPAPVLAVRGVQPVTRRIIGGGAHLGIGVTDGTAFADAIGFSMAGWTDVLTLTGASVDLAFTPEIDRGGGGRVRLRLRALDVPGVDVEHVLRDTGLVIERLFRRAGDFLGDPPYDGVENAAGFYTKVVGVTFDDRQAVLATLRPGDRLKLRREPGNRHDPHAVQVATADDHVAGYLNAQLAGRLAPVMDGGIRYVASVAGLTGGGGHPSGVNVFIEREPEAVPAGAADAIVNAGTQPPGNAGSSRAWRVRGAGGALESLPIHLNGGRPFRAGLLEALDLAVAGQRVALNVPPGRGRATAIAAAAAVAVAERRDAARAHGGVLVAVPCERHAVHRTAQLVARLQPLGVRVEPAHGLQAPQARDRLDELLRAGGVDVLVATAAVLRDAAWLAPFTRSAGTLILDGGSEADWPARPSEAVPPRVFVVGDGGACRAAARVFGATAIVHDAAPRAPFSMVDRRSHTGDLWPLLEEVLSKGEKTVAITAPRDTVVRLATLARDRVPGGRAAYLHGGLPLRLREIVTQAFREGRIDVLMATSAVDEEALPPGVQQLVLGAVVPDVDRWLSLCGAALAGHRPVTLTLAVGDEDRARYRRVLDDRAPGREALAAIYRAIREQCGEQPFPWPDNSTWGWISAAVPGITRGTVDAACAIFVEAGLAAREGPAAPETGSAPRPGSARQAGLPAGGSEAAGQIQLLPSAGRRDLAASVRYREGRRSRDAFEAAAAWALETTITEMQRRL